LTAAGLLCGRCVTKGFGDGIFHENRCTVLDLASDFGNGSDFILIQFNLLAPGIQVIEARNAINTDSDPQGNHDFGFLIHLITSSLFDFNTCDIFFYKTKNKYKKLRFFIVE
jgi:hypothetical protein